VRPRVAWLRERVLGESNGDGAQPQPLPALPCAAATSGRPRSRAQRQTRASAARTEVAASLQQRAAIGDEPRPRRLASSAVYERKRATRGPLLQESRDRARLDEGHPLLGWSLNNLGVWHYWRRELAAAEARIGEAVAQARAHDATGNAGFPVWLGNLGAVKLAQRDFAAAEPQLLEAHRLLLALRGPRHPQTASVVGSLVTLFTSLGQPQRAAEYSAQLRPAGAGEKH
jgi:hypothetical protein